MALADGPDNWHMDDAEIDRLRKTIRYSFRNSPHKKKYWLALLEMYGSAQGSRERSTDDSRGPERVDVGRGVKNRKFFPQLPGTDLQRPGHGYALRPPPDDMTGGRESRLLRLVVGNGTLRDCEKMSLNRPLSTRGTGTLRRGVTGRKAWVRHRIAYES